MGSELDNLKPIKYAQSDGSLANHAHDKDYMELTLKSGNHSDLVKKILRQRIEKRAKEFPRWPGSLTGGVRALWIESRFWYDRERLLPDFDEDWRKYRAKYLHSLELDPREPVHVPEYEKMLINPIRRLYMKPGDWVEAGIKKVFKTDRWQSSLYRVVVTRHFLIYLSCLAGYAYVRYFHSQWETFGGPIISRTAPIYYADHPNYPFQDYRKEAHDHHDENFSRRKIYRDLRDFEDTTVTL